MKHWKYLFCLLCCFCFFLFPVIHVKGETKQADIITTTVQKDLSVSFIFDSEIVDITFISPSGARKTKNSSDVEYKANELLAIYTIKNAEIGVWCVEYDAGTNNGITYNVLSEGDADYGIWIRSFTAKQISDTEMQFEFLAEFKDKNTNYNYKIQAINVNQSGLENIVASGSARTNQNGSVRANITGLSSGTYKYQLTVICQDEGFELFDSAETNEMKFTNNNQQPVNNKSFDVTVDVNNLDCEMDWSRIAPYSVEAYHVSAIADGQTLYDGELEKEYNQYSATFPNTTQKIELTFSYRSNGSWSQEIKKEIDLSKSTLYSENSDITGKQKLDIFYKTPVETTLNANVNNVEGSQSVKGDGKVSLNLQDGSNDVVVTMQVEEHITFVLKQTIYYDTIAPEIIFYENLDQKSVNSNKLSILGKVSGANALAVNGKEVQIADDGNFDYIANLTTKENRFVFEAIDVNGNISRSTITIFRAQREFEDITKREGFIKYLPFITAILLSMLIIVLCIAFMYKSEKPTGKIDKIIFKVILYISLFVADTFIIYTIIVRKKFAKSVAYLEMVEKSFQQASKYLTITKYFEIAMIIITLILVLSVAIGIARAIIKRNRK